MWSEEDFKRQAAGKVAALFETAEAKKLREEVNRPLQETDPKLNAELLAIVKENPTGQEREASLDPNCSKQ